MCETGSSNSSSNTQSMWSSSRIDGEPVAVAEPVEFEHLLSDRGQRHQLVEQAVGDDERQPPRVDEQRPGVALAGAVRVRVQVGRNVDVGQQPHAAGRRAGQHDRLGEHLRIGQRQLVGPVAAHRVARRPRCGWGRCPAARPPAPRPPTRRARPRREYQHDGPRASGVTTTESRSSQTWCSSRGSMAANWFWPSASECSSSVSGSVRPGA